MFTKFSNNCNYKVEYQNSWLVFLDLESEDNTAIKPEMIIKLHYSTLWASKFWDDWKKNDFITNKTKEKLHNYKRPRALIPNETNCETRNIVPTKQELPCLLPECPRKFFHLEDLKKHLKIHTDSLFKCNYCNRQFKSKSAVICHIRIHTGEKPYRCTVCPKSFSTLGILQTHTRTHTGEKPFECTICRRFFSQKSTLQAHMIIHNGKTPYNCKICAKLFAYRAALRRHIMRIHTDKLPCISSIGRKCHISKRHQNTRRVTKREKVNTPKNYNAKIMHKEDLGNPSRHHNEGVSMEATTTRMQPESKETTVQQSSVTCHVCHIVSPSLQDMCRHYCTQHNLPKVVMKKLVFQGEKVLLS